MESLLGMPTREEQDVAIHSLGPVKGVLETNPSGRDIKIQVSQESITIPKKALELLEYILISMAEGKAILLFPADSEVTTQQAADLLHVSRPHVVKMLERGEIPFKKVGTHRRIAVEDLISYQQTQKRITRKNLDFLVRQAQALNLGYE